jgi:hypothetical protein
MSLILLQFLSNYLSTLLANSCLVLGLGWFAQRQQKKHIKALELMQKQYMDLMARESRRNSDYLKMES